MFIFGWYLLSFIVSSKNKVTRTVTNPVQSLTHRGGTNVWELRFQCPLAGMISVKIGLLNLADKIGGSRQLEVRSAKNAPLPATIIDNRVTVCRNLRGMFFTPLPISSRIFNRRTNRSRPTTIIRPTHFLRLTRDHVRGQMTHTPLTPNNGVVFTIGPKGVLPLKPVKTVHRF